MPDKIVKFLNYSQKGKVWLLCSCHTPMLNAPQRYIDKRGRECPVHGKGGALEWLRVNGHEYDLATGGYTDNYR